MVKFIAGFSFLASLMTFCAAVPVRAAGSDDTMKEGLDFLYVQNQPAKAEPLFRQVLKTAPTHYGANYQLAAALEREGKKGAAKKQWEVVLKMAEQIDDQPTADLARAYLPGFPLVAIKTSLGEIKVRLNARRAPIATQNFLRYVNDKYYDGTIFHRNFSPFLIQGGALNPDMSPKKGVHYPMIKSEAANGLKNHRGAVAMARADDPDSAASQFYINDAENGWLDHTPSNAGYTVFGDVIEGIDVVDKMMKVPAQNSVPNPPIVIESVRVP
jgi:cyclophilin family peptidyl-prolyl cis-trans isomerase